MIQKNCKGTRDTYRKLIEKRWWVIASLFLYGHDWGIPARIQPMHPGNEADANMSTEEDQNLPSHSTFNLAQPRAEMLELRTVQKGPSPEEKRDSFNPHFPSPP